MIYEFGIRIYGELIRLAAFFNVKKAKQFVVGRTHWRQKLSEALAHNSKPIIWMHAASAGEFEQGRPLLELIREKHPSHFIVLTFFSPSGYEFRKNYQGADYIAYLPLDTKRNSNDFIQILNPQLALFVKYEFWPNLLNACKKQSIPTILFSSVFRKNQWFFNPFFKGPARKTLTSFSKIFVQDEASQALLNTIQIRSAFAPDTRFDRVYEISQIPFQHPIIENFCGGETVLVAGSTWPEDENLLMSISDQLFPAKMIWVPHDIHQSHLVELVQSTPNAVLLSELESGRSFENHTILIVDCFGLLSKLYRYATIAYIGGGFGKGIHNTLEAATYGIPVIFGPKYKKFNEAVGLIKVGAGFSVLDSSSLKEVLNHLQSTQFLEKSKRSASDFIHQNLGGTLAVYSACETLINGQSDGK